MKKSYLLLFMSLWTFVAVAQIDSENPAVIDLAEDTTQVNTIQDIIEIQELVSKSNSKDAHFENVWSRKTFFNLGYNMSSRMTAKQGIPLGYDNRTADEFKADGGAMLQLGHNYTLHRGAIANMLQFNIDFTYIDLNFNYFDAEPYAGGFDPKTNENLPWAAKKYNIAYGMTLGPSVTVAPLVMLDNRQLHFFKLNLYYHVGYHAGLLVMDQKRDADMKNTSFDNVVWSLGLSQSFGLSLSWKTIGLGWESRFAYDPKFKSFDGNGPKSGYKFKNPSSRIFISIRY